MMTVIHSDVFDVALRVIFTSYRFSIQKLAFNSRSQIRLGRAHSQVTNKLITLRNLFLRLSSLGDRHRVKLKCRSVLRSVIYVFLFLYFQFLALICRSFTYIQFSFMCLCLCSLFGRNIPQVSFCLRHFLCTVTMMNFAQKK